MKNFPHQTTQFSKLRATLRAIRGLNESGADSSDDGVLGDRLALDQVHRFRDHDYGDVTNFNVRIIEQLREEHDKPKANQGSRTAARENRKTLRYLGWLQNEGIGLTIAGEALLASADGSDEEMDILGPAVAQIKVPDGEGRISHPVQHLLRLVDSVAYDSRDGMELALEATNDTDDEYRRIKAMAQLAPDALRQQLLNSGVSKYSIDNARKILPAFAENSGLISRDGDGRYEWTSAGRLLARHELVPAADGQSAGTRRRSAPLTATTDPSKVGRSRIIAAAALSEGSSEARRRAAALVSERTERHQQLLRTTAAHCSARKYWEDSLSYDLVVDSGNETLVDLIEAKTIDGDAHNQVRLALGQLLDYEYFVVARQFPGRTIVKSVVVDADIDDDFARFLESQAVGLLVVTDDDVFPQNMSGEAIAKRLFSQL